MRFWRRYGENTRDATHNVYAYVIDENNIFRYSDDGEPGGTAGMPVLDTIRKEVIVDTAVVVTRYFGGTLLGTGGLVHAYGAAAPAGLAGCGNRDQNAVQCGLCSRRLRVIGEDSVYGSRRRVYSGGYHLWQ